MLMHKPIQTALSISKGWPMKFNKWEVRIAGEWAGGHFLCRLDPQNSKTIFAG